jgi:hypothetical protein
MTDRKNPYAGQPERQFNKYDAGLRDPSLFDPVSDVPFSISRDDRVVTAGSCFAQHVARYITRSGFNHYIAEPAHRIITPALAERYNYGLFSARYGNLYTARQLPQLIERAYGTFDPAARAWSSNDRFVDPFRPQIQPGAFGSEAEVEADRRQHLACVRDAIENMEVFVFTLGLTEAWVDKRDGAVFPLAPGVAGGTYDPRTVAFENFDEADTAADLRHAIDLIRKKNRKVRIILTVSPVPLNATFEDRHVYCSTAWSKAALRIAAEKVSRAAPDCCYFPSFEIITSPQTCGHYFGPDCREVLPAGVDHVMRLFFRHFAGTELGHPHGTPAPASPEPQQTGIAEEIERGFQLLCDEELLDNAGAEIGADKPAQSRAGLLGRLVSGLRR